MATIVTNLASVVRAPVTVLALPSEFLTVGGGGADAAMLTAHKMRMGTQWLGLKGTFGTLTKATLEHHGDEKEQPNGAPGFPRCFYWLKPGFKLSLTMHHDRGLPALRLGDSFSAWVDGDSAAATLLRFHINTISNDKGDEDTATIQVVATNRTGFDEGTTLVRAQVDEFGRVISYDDASTNKFSAAGSDPAGSLPTAHV